MNYKSEQTNKQKHCLNCGCRVPQTDGFTALDYISRAGVHRTIEICDTCSVQQVTKTTSLIMSVIASADAERKGAAR